MLGRGLTRGQWNDDREVLLNLPAIIEAKYLPAIIEA